MKKIAILLALFFFTAAFAKVNFPYPQEKAYSYGTYQENISNKVKAKFQAFYSGYYEESGDYARIKFDDGTYTVSEGIGYGMIMMVYFSDNNKSYQTEFDKLWNYYQHWSDGNGLMNWKINGFNSVVGQNAATDAEFDVAFSLIMAYYQFGDEKYKTAAQGILAKIRAFEMESDGLHKPGDTWNSSRNPGYVSPAAFELFKDFDNANFWAAAITRNYALLKANQNSTTGLPSGWSDDNGNPVTGTASSIQYDWDAPRAPWRLAWSYAWYGHSDALSLLSKLGSWLNNKNANDLKIPMNLDGSNGQYNNSTAVGPFACAMMHSSNYATKRESFASALLNINESSYFSSAMQILTGLLLSGNMQNFAAMSPGNNSSSSSAVVNPTSSASNGTTSVIDDFEDGNNIANTGLEDYWYVFTDSGNKGKSTVTNAKEDGEYVVVSSDFAKSSDYGVGMKGIVLNKGSNANQPYVTLGLNVEGGLAGCKTFTYDYKGAAHNFKVVMEGDENGELTGYAYHQSSEVASTSWTSTSIAVATGLNQPSWVDDDNVVSLNISKVIKVQWEVQGANKTGNQVPSPADYLYIDNFACDGMSIVPVVIPDDESSSSTKPKSSSSATTVSSSSHVNPTCVDGDEITTPVHLVCVAGEWTEVKVSSSSAASTVVMIDDVDDGNTGVETLGEDGYWFLYTAGGSISNTQGADQVWDMVRGNSSNYYVAMENISGITYGDKTYPSVGMSMNIPASALAGCSAIKYDYKGSGHMFRAAMSTVTAESGYEHATGAQSKATSWTTVTVNVGDLKQPTWIPTTEKHDFAWNLVYQLVWVVDEKIADAQRGTELDVDNVQCVGSLPGIGGSSSSSTSSSSAEAVCTEGQEIIAGGSHVKCVNGQWVDMNAGGSSSSAGPAFVLVDDFEDGDNVANTGAEDYWYAFTDSGNTPPGRSTISNTKSDGDYVVVFPAAAADGSGYGLGLTGINLQDGPNFGEYDKPSVTLGFNVEGGLAGCTEISYKYKGAGHNLKTVMKGDEKGALTEYNYHKAAVDGSTSWSTANVAVNSLKQEPYWGKTTTLKIANVVKLQWEVKGEASSDYLYVDDVKCIGMTSNSSTKPNSSSSVRPTSSSGSNGSNNGNGYNNNGNNNDYGAAIGVTVATAGLKATLQGNTLMVNVAKAGLVKVQVFDMMGHVIESHSESMAAGSFSHTFGTLSKGFYVVRVQQGSMVKALRMQVR